MPELTELALDFARAIVRPGGLALLIDERNGGEQWVPLEEASSSGLAFAVEPTEHVVAIDIDSDSDRAWADRVRAGLTLRECQFVQVESGRPGHGHLWVLTPPGWNYDYLKMQMEQVAGRPASWGQVRRNATRPPCAPHRLGGRSRVADPDPETALELFRSHRPRGVPHLAANILTWLDPSKAVHKRGELDRGKSIHKAAVSLVNARCPESDFVALLGNRNPVTSKYHDLPSDRRADFAARAWLEACKFVRQNPPAAARRETVEGLLKSTQSMRWRARTGANDRKVYESLLGLGQAACSLVVNASVRQLADLAAMSPGGVRAATNRLVQQGFIERVEEPERPLHHASSFRLLLDPPRNSLHLEHTLPIHGGPKARCVKEANILADIFSGGEGLGASARQTWDAVPTTPTKASEVLKKRGGDITRGSVLRHLRRLAELGFVLKEGHRWSRRVPSANELEFIASHLGVRHKLARQRQRHERERAAYLSRFLPSGQASATA